MTGTEDRHFRVLFLCTGNSARSQMAEALLNWKGKGRFVAESAGSKPAGQVNPRALRELESHRIPSKGRPPRGLEGLDREPWDLVITVCDRAKESCPLFAGQPVLAHWGMADPAEAQGTEAEMQAAFRGAYVTLSRRIDLLVALPLDKLERLAVESRVRAIGTE